MTVGCAVKNVLYVALYMRLSYVKRQNNGTGFITSPAASQCFVATLNYST